jgi:hypothetical protein
LGGQALRGTFRIIPDIPKNVSGCTTFFPKYEKNFPDMPKKFSGYMIFFTEMNKNFPEITYIQVFKSALWAKNAILMTFFTQEKGTWQSSYVPGF